MNCGQHQSITDKQQLSAVVTGHQIGKVVFYIDGKDAGQSATLPFTQSRICHL